MQGKNLLKREVETIERALRRLHKKKPRKEIEKLYKMIEYAAGLRDEQLRPYRVGGKRLRGALALYLADAYGAKVHALDAALAIELFHNFTLVHDDIADRDQMRREKPTLWKLAGEAHALNAGDTLAFLSLLIVPAEMRAKFLETFVEVCEGQFLDFEIGTMPLQEIAEIDYMLMTQKKTGALFGLAAATCGMLVKKSPKEIAYLAEFGTKLGVAFQMMDDYRSIWQTRRETGKDTHSDLREKKRTLPILLALEEFAPSERKNVERLYAKVGALTEQEVMTVLKYISATDAQEKMREKIEHKKKEAKEAADRLTISEKFRIQLASIVDVIVPDVS